MLTTLAALLLIAVLFSSNDDDNSGNDDSSVAGVVGEATASETSPSAAPTVTATVTVEPSTPTATRTQPRGTPTKPKSTAAQPSAVAPTKQPPPPPVRYYAVTDVVDGDTVKVAWHGETTLRIIGIDTPETVDPSSPVECGGPRASQLATQLLTGKRVRLVFDPSQGRLDRYGRTLAYIEARGLGDFGLAMIKRGAAAEYTYDTVYARQRRYQQAERQARASKRGLWGLCGGPHVAPSTPPPATTAAPPPPPPPPHPPPAGGGCASDYSPCVPPYPPDLDCPDVGGPIQVTGDDPHGLDADGDGIACET